MNWKGAVAHLGERIPCTDEVASSILVSSTTISPIAQLVEQLTVNQSVAGSSPARGAMLTVAQLVEHQIVVLTVASSILVCQPKRPHRSVRPRTQDCQSCNMGSNPIGAATKKKNNIICIIQMNGFILKAH